jgi:DNA-binding transcriptional regulator YiaG
MKNTTLKTQQLNVHIPNLEGDGIAEIVPVDVQTYFDPDLGEDVLTPESLELIDRVKARRMGLLLPEEIKELRERLKLTQKEMSDLLQIGEKSYTRWESGRARPSRSMNVVLCALRDGQLDVNYLRVLQHPTARTVWSARETPQPSFASSLVHGHEPVEARLASAVAGEPPEVSPRWQDFRPAVRGSAPWRGFSRSKLLAALHEHLRAHSAEGGACAAPLLPSTSQQRQVFMSQRFVETTSA